MSATGDATFVESSFALARHPAEPELLLWLRQFWVVFRISIRRSMFSRQMLLVLILALLPIAVMFAIALSQNFAIEAIPRNIEYSRRTFGFVYSTFILAAVIFLGSAVCFTTIFRGEILERSIHYFLLAPIRREIIVLSKYCAGIISAFLLFSLTTLVCYLEIYIPFGGARLAADLGSGIATSQLSDYLVMTLLATIGYGSLFTATGLMFRNPLMPIMVVAGIDLIHPYLPSTLKYISVLHYVMGQMPVIIYEGPFAILSAPLPLWGSYLGVVGIAVVAVGVAVFFLRRFEVKYTGD